MNRREFLVALGGSTALALIDIEGARAVSPATLAQDPLRPQYHLLPAGNWMNDPNGPIWWKGKFHLFYQLNPRGATWGQMNWGHAVSTDMVHWHHDPVALSPTPGGPDSEGCFSGSAVVFNGVPTIIYTGVKTAPHDQVTLRDAGWKLREEQLLATAEDDDLIHWKKRSEPVIAVPPPSINETGFRDPCLWKEADGWYLGLGSGERGKGGCVLLYRSQNLRHWEYLHPLLWGRSNGKSAPNPCDSGEMWECPDFFPLGDCHCLLYSTEGRSWWATGHYDQKAHLYTPERHGTIDQGAYYAAKSFRAPDGRRILWGWVQESRSETEFVAAGWAGVMSLPRVLAVGNDGRLRMTVAKEVQQLRGPERRIGGSAILSGNRKVVLAELSGCCGELEVNARSAGHSFELRFAGNDGTSWLEIKYAPGRHPRFIINEQSLPLNLNADEPLLIQAFVDGSVIELFLNNQQALTKRFYYSGRAQTCHISWRGRPADFISASSWELSPISDDRLTR